ncbi:MAG: hypothetical protein PHZ09_09075 [Eubacteriales bacterium]|nr:hypothetical protein [Eubacteriales bacterium]
MSGCNVAGDQSDCIYLFNIRKYMNDNIYQNGTMWLYANKIVERCAYGVITDGILTNDDLVRLLQLNLIVKSDTRYVLNFACFTREQFAAFAGLFSAEDEKFAAILTELILSIKKSFVSFVPKRLDGQINQWISCFIHSIIGYVSDELISRGVLEKPDDEKPLTNGVFHVKGDYINV